MEKKETKKEKNFYKKWWFWIIVLLAIIIICFTAIIVVALMEVTSGIEGLALEIQSIDSESTVYASAGSNVIIIDIPNYTDNIKYEKIENIKSIITDYANKNEELSSYESLIIVKRMNDSDGSANYLVSTTMYKLPEMTESTDDTKVYVDLVKLTTNSTSSDSSIENTDDTSNTTSVNTNTSSNTISSNIANDTTTIGEKNALAQAKKYLNYTAFSYKGLIEQLEYEGYSTEEATYGADNCGADWNEQAAKKAQQYIEYSSFSRSGLIEQLEYEGFTAAQAEYGVTAVGY